MIPLRTIFLLERIEAGEESSIEELNPIEAFSQLIEQTHRPEDPKTIVKTLHLFKAMVERVKI